MVVAVGAIPDVDLERRREGRGEGDGAAFAFRIHDNDIAVSKETSKLPRMRLCF